MIELGPNAHYYYQEGLSQTKRQTMPVLGLPQGSEQWHAAAAEGEEGADGEVQPGDTRTNWFGSNVSRSRI